MNWDKFEKQKHANAEDPRCFSFKDWEIEYLVKEIGALQPKFSEIQILKAILVCCETVESPNLKLNFYHRVMKRLIETKK